METQNKTVITIETTVNVPVEKAWKIWNTVDDIIKWNSPSPEWHTPRAENDLRKEENFFSAWKPGTEAPVLISAVFTTR